MSPRRVVDGEAMKTSDRVNQVSRDAELFYRRLIENCDDYGRFEGRPSVIRGLVYPLRLHEVSEDDLTAWITEAVRAGLIWIYEVGRTPYIEVLRWFEHQRQRTTRPKYPAPQVPPPEHVLRQVAADGGELPPEVDSDSDSEELQSAQIEESFPQSAPDDQVYLLGRLEDEDPGWGDLPPKALRRANLRHSPQIVTSALRYLREAPPHEPVRNPSALLEAVCQQVLSERGA